MVIKVVSQIQLKIFNMTKEYIKAIYLFLLLATVSYNSFAQQPVKVKTADTTKQVELIPLGFGMMRDKNEITSAIGIAKSADLDKRMVINPANALFGMIPGLAVMQKGGASWENDPQMLIRGAGTFRDASMLILIDGYERPISSLSPGEIESVVILKDAGALAIYGIRGANGVLLVTTKRGETGRNKVDINYEHGITQATRLPKFLDAYGYALAMNQARANDGLTALYPQQALDAYQSGSSPFFFPNVNWQEESFKDFGKTNNFRATFQGKTNTVRYFTLVNYQNDEGLLKPVNENEGYSNQLKYGKFNFRSNVDVNITKTTLFKVGLSGNLRETNTPGNSVSSLMRAIYNTPSNAFPVKTYNNIFGGTPNFTNNPVGQISAMGYQNTQIRELLADASLEQKLDVILPGLVAEASVAYDNSATYAEGKLKQYRYQSLSLINGTGGQPDSVETIYRSDSELAFFSNLSNQWSHATVQGKLKYAKSWSGQSMDAMLLYQQDKLIRNGQSNTYIHQLFSGVVHYAKDSKYFADLVVAYSGTNVLPKNNRFGVFPAVSIGWKMSEEKWFNKGLLNDLKIRASWGMTGNDLVPQNLSEVQFNGTLPYYFTQNNNSSVGWQEGRIPSDQVTYETATKHNLGIDASLLGMFDLNVDLFYDRRKNILVESDGLVSSVLGAAKPLLTEGIVTNRGVEAGLKFYHNKGGLSYYIGGQFAYSRNKIVAMAEAFQPYSYLSKTGKSIGQSFGLEAIGFFQDAADIAESPLQTFSAVRPGDIKYKDQNGDGIINVNDEKALKYNTVNPEIYYSASLGVQYKGLGIDAVFQGIAHKSVYLNTRSIFWPLSGNNNISEFSANSWTPATATSATLPRLSTLGNENNYRSNSTWMADASYFKLRSLMVYYNLPQKVISKLKLSSTKIILRGMDLFSIDKIDVVDPEAIGAVYPIYSTYSLGLQIGF
jgi:TonB-linked SusC/RagA family outer membrane protein